MESQIQTDLECYYKNKNVLIVVEEKEEEIYTVNVVLFDNVKLSRDIKIDSNENYMSNICVIIKVINNMIINYFRNNDMYRMSITEK